MADVPRFRVISSARAFGWVLVEHVVTGQRKWIRTVLWQQGPPAVVFYDADPLYEPNIV